MFVGGIDEAGRGSVLGPLVVAGISIDESMVSKLTDLGVKDSKILSRKKRDRLFHEIVEIVEITCVYKIDCKTIDDNVYHKNLNKLEGTIMSSIIKHLDVDIAYVDSCDVNIDRYTDYLRLNLNTKKITDIVAMHKADRQNIVVSGASIIAKVIRDNEIQILQEKFHDIGSGYPSDKKTMEFINKLSTESDEFPPYYVRKSWKPIKNLIEKQRKIYEFT